MADGVEHAPNLNALRNVLAELFERIQLIKGDDLSPLSTYTGDGMATLDDLPATGEGLWLVPILRGGLPRRRMGADAGGAARACTYGPHSLAFAA